MPKSRLDDTSASAARFAGSHLGRAAIPPACAGGYGSAARFAGSQIGRAAFAPGLLWRASGDVGAAVPRLPPASRAHVWGRAAFPPGLRLGLLLCRPLRGLTFGDGRVSPRLAPGAMAVAPASRASGNGGDQRFARLPPAHNSNLGRGAPGPVAIALAPVLLVLDPHLVVLDGRGDE